MESQIKLLTRLIVEEPLSNIPSNTITMQDVKEQMMMFPIGVISPRSQEPLLITTVVEKSKKVECLSENKNEYEEDELEKETESCMEKTEIDESWKRPKENDEERRHLMKFKGNFENAKRDQSLCYEKARMSFSKKANYLITLKTIFTKFLT
ncbi:hypothetical protein M9H77_35976 [Catharanthus roseus]|uniref:Uncharacterized protein n=1 Tax=Catharanthus roseus TaxID=4058 RepID=A0ACB9ZQH7_CATRO|nr:hypothetical protein M9H77_35976 [Catharanthus roseus]